MGIARRAMLGCALALGALLVAACAPSNPEVEQVGGAPTTTSTTAQASTTTTGPPAADTPIVGVGEAVTGDGFDVTVHAVSDPAPEPAPRVTARPGHRFIGVDFEITSVSNVPRDVTYLRVELWDAARNNYEPLVHGDNLPTGWLPPDHPIRVTLLFEVPELAQGFVLDVRADTLSEPAVGVLIG